MRITFQKIYTKLSEYGLSSNLTMFELSTVVIAYKNIVGSREKCSYNRYVLITDIYDL